jgi:glycosyltransferase involved in cell wall biosynthesis
VPEPLPVTVVIPAYNRPDMVARAVRSALGQRPRPPAEVIVVDDCSSDGTGDAASAAGATVIRHDVNRGEGAARNTAIRAAGEEWIALLDSDDEFLPGHLAALWPHRNGHVILGSSGIACAPDPADDGLIGRARETSQLLRSPADLLYGGNALVATSVIVRRDAVLEAGLFAEGMLRGVDLDLWLRVLERGTGYVSPDVTVRYHLHEGQLTGDDAPMWMSAHRAVVDAYNNRPWFSRAASARSEARVMWDQLRLDLRNGDRVAALRVARQIASDVYRTWSLIELLAYRFLLRRRRGRYTRSGTSSLRVWASNAEVVAAVRHRGLVGVEPLRPRGFYEGLDDALRRPAGVTITDSLIRAATARVGGSKIIRTGRGKLDGLDSLLEEVTVTWPRPPGTS